MGAKRLKPVPGLCDRCDQRFPLDKLRWEYIIGKPTRMRVCRSCWDPSHPQLDTRNLKTNDKQSVIDSRSDAKELPEERRLYGFNPVGSPLTSTAQLTIGRVTVEIT
jgi:hypothetical protein